MENIKEFNALIKRYKSITLESLNKSKKELEGEYEYELDEDEISAVLEKITNFGTKNCSLCEAIGMEGVGDIENCQNCTWVKLTGSICFQGDNNSTYHDIEYSTSILKLEKAISKRAKYMEEVLNKTPIK